MSLKNIALAFAATFALTGSALASDLMDDLASMDLASINNSSADIEVTDLDGLDIDQMAEEAGEETDAIEACFRRFGGHRRGGWGNWGGHRNFGHFNYGRHNFGHYANYGYNHCYRPLYSYQPVVTTYTHCLPMVTNYWGCY